MTTTIDINGKKLLTIKAASEQVSYSRDYITRLAREKKIVATQLGRFWYVDLSSLKNYEEASQTEQDIRKRRLSDERKRDLLIKEKRAQQRKQALRRAGKKLPVTAVIAFVVFSGMGLGLFFESNGLDQFMNPDQVANLKTGVLESEMPEVEIIVLDDFVGEDDPLQPEFESRYQISSLESQNGLLLLPQDQHGDFDPTEFFSDPVEVVEGDDGRQYVERVSDDEIKQTLPFVVVPVNSNSP